MRVLVTGSSGHVGGAIAAHLSALGWQVVGLRRSVSNCVNLAEQIQAELGAPDLVDNIMGRISPCSAIVHAAAARDKDLYASAISLSNCLGTQQILQIAHRWKVQRIVYLSGISIIGTPLQFPITEDHPLHPPTAYHASKLFGEHLVRLANEAGLTGTILRLTSPVGPGMSDNRIFPVFVRRALANEPLHLAGRGLRQQNYVDVRDVAAAVNQCLRNPANGVFNVAGASATSNLALAQACIRMLNSTSEIQFTGQPDPQEGVIWDVSIAKAAREFGYCPAHGIEDSIRAAGNEHAHRSD